jgi:hypothetical protein
MDVPRIALLGASSSGKATYLGALRLAVEDRRGESGAWNIFPVNVESADMMARIAHCLVAKRAFPEPAALDAAVELQWQFVGDIARTKFDHRRLRRGIRQKAFLLDLIDVAGADDYLGAGGQPGVLTRIMDRLAGADGIIYLFDPVSEWRYGISVDHVNVVLGELRRRPFGLGQQGSHLPQHVAVCVTKFDHPAVFRQARELGLVSVGPDGMPRVLDKDAELFFDVLCPGGFWGASRGGSPGSSWGEGDGPGHASAPLVQNALREAFGPRNISYHVTSSIGFRQPLEWTPATSAVDPADFDDRYERADGDRNIGGVVRPINVLEPLVGLVAQIERRRSGH